MTEKVIALNHLVKKFGKNTILRDVNLTIYPGQIMGLIGPSGAGKTTIIKTMLGMEKADDGEALVFGEKMPNRQLLSRIGYMAQADALYTDLTGKENLKFFAKMKSIKKSQIEEEIKHQSEIVDLTDYLDQRVSTYSGGMMRRLSLAIALLGKPELLI